MNQPKSRRNYSAMRAEKVEVGIWRHFEPQSGWERFRVFASVEGMIIQEYFKTLGEARSFLKSIKSGPKTTWPGYKKLKTPDHNGNPLPRGVQHTIGTSRGGRYVTHRYVASYRRNGRIMNQYFTFDPADRREAATALRAALKARRTAEKIHGPPLR